MNLKTYTLDNSQEWDKIVESFKDHDIYYLSGYLRCLKIIGDGEPVLFFYENENCRGINVVLKRDISLDKNFVFLERNKFFDITTPYGYGGWIIEGENPNNLFKEYEKWCFENNVICEFVRFHPLIENQKLCEEFYDVIPLGKVISMNCSNEQLLWDNMSSRNRNKIKKAKKAGITIACCEEEKLDNFIEIYNETMKRDNAEEYYFFDRDYYDCMFKNLKDRVKIFTANYNGEIISTTIVFYCNGKANYHLSGSKRNSNNLYETQCLLYEVGKWAHENNCKSFLLGGGVGSKEDNLFIFKREFDKKNDYQFYIGKKIFNNEKYNELVLKRTDIKNHGFFPEYRG